MKKLKNNLIFIFFVTAILFSKNVYAKNKIKAVELKKEYKDWIQLPAEERENTIAPRMFDIPNTSIKYTNPLRYLRLVGNDNVPKFSLTEKMNLEIKDQGSTKLCWAFSALSSLETNLALRDIHMQIEPKEYDFSEKHMDYAMVYSLNEPNIYGLNRKPGSTGNNVMALSYLTNGLGAVDESEMEFDYEINDVTFNELIKKDVATQVYDTIDLSLDIQNSSPQDLETIKGQMKDHIKNYGSMSADIYYTQNENFYKKEKGALYCDDKQQGVNHSVSIIGWNDTYSKDNFAKKPNSDGAWIIRDSHGLGKDLGTYASAKETLYNALEPAELEALAAIGITDKTDEKFDEFVNASLDELGLVVIDDYVYRNRIFVSYEDVNIYSNVSGIIKANDEISYDNIYQYNESVNCNAELELPSSKVYIANIFEREKIDGKSDLIEELNQISLYAPEKYICRVFVNPNGSGLETNDLVPVALKDGDTKTFETAGYHTIEFAEPIPLKSDKFAVVVEIQGTRDKVQVAIESNYKEVDESKFTDQGLKNYIINTKDLFKNIQNQDGKCFIKYEDKIDAKWKDMSKIPTDENLACRGDLTIKAFTNFAPEVSSIKITKLPISLETEEYTEGDELDLEGLEITVYFKDGEPIVISDDDLEEFILDGYIEISENCMELAKGENIITVTCGDFKDSFKVTAKAKTQETEGKEILGIIITSEPDKIEGYNVGDEIDLKGLEVTVLYDDDSSDILSATDYTISNKVLKAGTNVIQISYKGFNDSFEVEVTNGIPVGELQGITITNKPNKMNYNEGEYFDPTGMVVTATYNNGETADVTEDCTWDESPLTKENEVNGITIVFNGKSYVLTGITINADGEENKIVDIDMKQWPELLYIEGESFNPDGMVIVITYENGETKEISSGFNLINNENLQADQTTVTVEFGGIGLEIPISVDKKTLQKIEITNPPTTTQYKAGDSFNSNGMVVEAVYQKNIRETIYDYTVTNGNSLKANQKSVTIKYGNLTVPQTITVETSEQEGASDEEEPKNSSFDQAIQYTKAIKAYLYTDTSKGERDEIDIEIKNIKPAQGNDSTRYYYYVSSSKESDIRDWVEIDNAKITNGTLKFTINTDDLPNAGQISEGDFLYLYLKEVAEKDGVEKTAQIGPSKIELQDADINIYLDDVLIQSEKSNNDETTAPIILPNTGAKIAIALTLILSVFVVIRYIKYRKLKGIK